MLATFTILVVLTTVASLIYNAIPSQVTWLRRGLILLVSATVIYAFNPRTLAIAILITAFAFGVYILARRFPARSWIPWLVMAPLVLNAITEVAFDRNWGDLLPFPTGSPVSPMITQLATLGLSFYSFKLYISIKEGLHADALRVRDMLTGVLFFPSFPIGPIDGAAAFNDAAIRRPADPRLWLLGLARIGMGAAKIYLVADWLTNELPVAIGFHSLEFVQTHAFTSPTRALTFMLLSFLLLYLNFSGFSDIAIGAGLMFNLHLTENFHYPLLSSSIQNFWQRWNLSLSSFITKYLFKPLLRSTGRPVVSLIIAFTLIGLWHRVSLGYLFWGLAHGTALGVALWWRRRDGKPLPMPNSIRQLGGIVLTLLFVSFVSTIANMPNWHRTQQFLGALIGQ